MHGIDLILVMRLKVGWLAWPPFFLPPPSSWIILLLFLLLILLGVFLIFGCVYMWFGRDLESKNGEKWFLALEMFLSLFLLVLAEPMARWEGGLCFIFLFFYCFASKNQLCIKCLSFLVLVVLAKPWANKWFYWQVGFQTNHFPSLFTPPWPAISSGNGAHLVHFQLLSLSLVRW